MLETAATQNQAELERMLAEIADLDRVQWLLAWDERITMPPGGAAARAEHLATLASIQHRLSSSDRLGELLDEAEGQTADGGDELARAIQRVARRDWEKARRVPTELRAELARESSLAQRTWETARAESDFPALLPHLDRLVELQRRYVDCFEFDHSYDPLLDDFEPGMTHAQLRPILSALKEGVAPLLRAIEASPVELDDGPLHGEFDPERQAILTRELIGLLPLSPDTWRLDRTVHPFATPISPTDLRITTRYESGYVGTAVWALVHEVGHALYGNGIPPELARTPLGRSASYGFDESQSRMWENWVGRGRPFQSRLLPLLANAFPDRFGSLDAEQLYRAANAVRPTLIRVDADEVTYNLHIVLRFELEVGLIDGTLSPAELPEAWAALTSELLGLEVPDDASGVLQDVHWAAGAFGYFPTYALGNVIAGQLWELARAELPDLDAQLAAGELWPLRELMRDRVHSHGARFWPAELIEELTGGPLDPRPLLAQLGAKYGELYEL